MKNAVVLLAVIFVMTISPIQDVQQNTGNVIVRFDKRFAEIQRADIIVTKYRIYNNVFQYRRWNETREYWVDPDWIDFG